MNTPKYSLIDRVRNRVLRKIFAIGVQRRESDILSLPVTPLQNRHVANCLVVHNREAMLRAIGVREIVAEIGVNKGEFSRSILDITCPTYLHLIDMWGSKRYHDGLRNWVEDSFRSEIERGIVYIHQKSSLEASSAFRDGYFDFIYIDTDHSYQTTRDELIAYEPKMKSGAIIAGHDYSMGNWISSYKYGVIEAVHEFCVKRDWELIYLTADITESCSFAIRKLACNK
jgi:hypothetical protein